MGNAPYPLRPIREAEFRDYTAVMEEAFGKVPSPVFTENIRSVTDLDRTLGAFDGTDIVGTAATYDLTMTVPGGPRPVAGVTQVSVLPSHQRRGLLTALMTRQLTDLHENGESVAALHASEAAIYARYGYGAASWQVGFTVHRGEGGFIAGSPDGDTRLRTVDPQEAWPRLSAVYDAFAPTCPGMPARDGAWWNRRLYDPEQDRAGYGPLLCVTSDEGDGYALFAVRAGWADDLPAGEVTVRELIATTPAAYASLWRQLLNRDLISTVHASMRPVDDPLRHLVADPRRLRARVADALWVRLVDVRAALAERAYAAPVDVVIEVTDPTCVWNRGRWHLSGDATGAVCERSVKSADIAVRVEHLGAAYLGGTGLASLGRAGLVRELRSGALPALSRALGWDPQPWCPMIF